MDQRKITSAVDLLDDKGCLLHPGYATQMQWRYDPRKIKARPFALKEWDFFQVQAGEWIVQFTLGHVSYAWNAAVTLLRSRGVSVIEENMFENRYRHVDELTRMGAEIRVSGRTAVVSGVETLHGATLRCTDLRGGAALCVAAAECVGV